MKNVIVLAKLSTHVFLRGRNAFVDVGAPRRCGTRREEIFHFLRTQSTVFVLVVSFEQRNEELLAFEGQFCRAPCSDVDLRKKIIPRHVELVVVAEFPKDRPSRLVSTSLDKQTVEENKSAECDAVSFQAVVYVLFYDGFDVLEDLKLQRRTKTSFLKRVELAVV